MDGDDCCTRGRWRAALTHVDELTAREREVFALLGDGGSNQEIADGLFITERTVRAHIGEIQRKLRLPSRLRACIASYLFTNLVASDNGSTTVTLAG